MIGFITKWIDGIAQYFEMRFQLIKLNVIERISQILSYFLFSFIALFIALAILIFLGMGLSEYFAELMDSEAGGYFTTTGIYILMLLILFGFRKSIASKLSGVFIGMLTDGDDEDEKETGSKNSPSGNND